MPAVPGLTAVVPAGGAGTRLWPLSRRSYPKFLLDLTGQGRSLLQGTWDRLLPLVGRSGVVVVTGAAHAAAVRAQLPDLAERELLLEPSPRDSMPAIGLAAAVLHQRDPDALLGSFAADHVVRDEPAFYAAVHQAAAAARTGLLVTIGIEPTSPAAGFGYIRSGDALGIADAPDARQATGFVEKPNAATAARYLTEGGYRWNAGMFLSRADVLLGHLRRGHPDLHDGLREVAAAWDGEARADVLSRVWPTLTRISIDHAVAEPAAAAGAVAVVPADLGWGDVGDFAAVSDLLAGSATATALRVLGDRAQVLGLDSDGVVVAGSGRAVAVLGVDDVVVVDTPDALLVTTRARAQEVKAVVEALRAAGRDDLL
jgi:mannose-1-phosphate guanylyltransferase